MNKYEEALENLKNGHFIECKVCDEKWFKGCNCCQRKLKESDELKTLQEAIEKANKFDEISQGRIWDDGEECCCGKEIIVNTEKYKEAIIKAAKYDILIDTYLKGTKCDELSKDIDKAGQEARDETYQEMVEHLKNVLEENEKLKKVLKVYQDISILETTNWGTYVILMKATFNTISKEKYNLLKELEDSSKNY